jgi:DNA transformation protein
MAKSNAAFKDLVLARLSALGGVTCRAMFGGHGLYLDGQFFGIVYKNKLFFRTSDATRPEYEAHGMQPFLPVPGTGKKPARYYEVPASIVADEEQLQRWAWEAARA